MLWEKMGGAGGGNKADPSMWYLNKQILMHEKNKWWKLVDSKQYKDRKTEKDRKIDISRDIKTVLEVQKLPLFAFGKGDLSQRKENKGNDYVIKDH